MKTQSTLLFFLLLLLGLNVNAQKVDLSLRFNAQNASYEVFAKPDFTKGEFLIGAGSQVTVIIPSDFQDEPLAVNTFTEGQWIDQSPIYKPSELAESDLHTFISEGGVLNFVKGEELKLFSFVLPLSYDHKKVRLFINKKDPTIRGQNRTKNLNNFIANDLSLTDFYRQNYSIVKDIKGHLKDWRGYPMEGVGVKVGNQSMTSLYDGRFEYQNVLVDELTNFSFEKAIDPKAGINAADLIRFQQHLSGEKKFDQPFQWIAADLDGSGTITYDDLDRLKAVLNGENTEIGWRFVPTTDFEKAATSRKPIGKEIAISKSERIYSIDFVGVKLGDVNGSYTLKPDIPNDIEPSPKALTINLLNKELKAGENYVIPFSTNDFALLTAYQLTLKIEKAEITQLENTFRKKPGLSLKQLPKDIVTANWINDKIGRRVAVNQPVKESSHQSETAILELEIVPQMDGLLSDFVTLLDNPQPTEAYDTDGQVMALQLLFRKAPDEEGTLELYQNRPNPFKETTTIDYYLPKDGAIKLTLTNEAGQVVKVYQETGKEGFNYFTISGEDVPKGLIYYLLETDFGKMSKKMLHLY